MRKGILHPNKVGTVGAKKKPEGEKKVAVRIYRKRSEVDQMGGIEDVKCQMNSCFDELLKLAK